MKLRSIKFYAKKEGVQYPAILAEQASCGTNVVNPEGARLAHLDHSSSQSECRICLILPARGFSHMVILTRTRTRSIIILLFVFASLCSIASLWRWGVTTKTARRIKSSFPSKEKQRTTWQWWVAGEKIFLNDLYNIPIRVKQLMLWVPMNPELFASHKSRHVVELN